MIKSWDSSVEWYLLWFRVIQCSQHTDTSDTNWTIHREWLSILAWRLMPLEGAPPKRIGSGANDSGSGPVFSFADFDDLRIKKLGSPSHDRLEEQNPPLWLTRLLFSWFNTSFCLVQHPMCVRSDPTLGVVEPPLPIQPHDWWFSKNTSKTNSIHWWIIKFPVQVVVWGHISMLGPSLSIILLLIHLNHLINLPLTKWSIGCSTSIFHPRRPEALCHAVTGIEPQGKLRREERCEAHLRPDMWRIRDPPHWATGVLGSGSSQLMCWRKCLNFKGLKPKT